MALEGWVGLGWAVCWAVLGLAVHLRGGAGARVDIGGGIGGGCWCWCTCLCCSVGVMCAFVPSLRLALVITCAVKVVSSS